MVLRQPQQDGMTMNRFLQSNNKGEVKKLCEYIILSCDLIGTDSRFGGGGFQYKFIYLHPVHHVKVEG